jgi:uncharacterized membrane protein YadS
MMSLRKLQPQAVTNKAIRLSALVVVVLVVVVVAINSSKSQEKNQHQQIIAIYYYEGFKTAYMNSNKVERNSS